MFCYSAKNDQKVVGERALKTKDIGKIWEHEAQKKCVKENEKTFFFFLMDSEDTFFKNVFFLRLYLITRKFQEMYIVHISKHEELMHRHLGYFHKNAVKELADRDGSNDNSSETSK